MTRTNHVALHSGYLPTLSLCSGVGGLELGVHLVCPGARAVCFVEREAYAAASLVARMEESALGQAPIWDDLVTFDGDPWRGKVSLVTAGFPCQPFSVAGQRKGTADERWLWDDIARILREVEPRYILLENVSGLLQFRGGIGRVLGDLAEMGFDSEWGCFTAASVGAPHRRERVFILSARRDDIGGGGGLPDAIGGAVRVESRRSGGADGSRAAEPGHLGEGPLADDDLAGRDRVAAGDGTQGRLEVEPRHDALGQDPGLPGGGGEAELADAGRRGRLDDVGVAAEPDRDGTDDGVPVADGAGVGEGVANAADAESGGGGVADARRSKGRRKGPRRRPGRRKTAARAGGNVADTAGERKRESHDEAGADAREVARANPGGGGGVVADTEDDRHELAGGPRDGRAGSSDGGGPVADASDQDKRSGLGQRAAAEAGGKSGAARCGEELAHAEGDAGGGRDAVAERGAAAGPCGDGEGLADPAGAGLPVGDGEGDGAAGQRDAEPQRGGGRLADAAGGGARDAGARREAPERGGVDEGLADAGGSGLPDGEQRGEPGAAECGEEAGAAASELRGARGGGDEGDDGNGLVGLPPFPPGPGDREFWGIILNACPELAPAVARGDVEDPARVPSGERPGRERVLDGRAEEGGGDYPGDEGADQAGGGEAPESPVRRLAHGLAAALACRADSLRAAGNGVVGAQAAVALVVLARRLGVAHDMGLWPDLLDALGGVEI